MEKICHNCNHCKVTSEWVCTKHNIPVEKVRLACNAFKERNEAAKM